MTPGSNSDEYKKWRTEVDRMLGGISENVTTILLNQRASAQACVTKHVELESRIKEVETHDAQEAAVKKWKDRFFGGFLTILGIVTGFLAKVLLGK